MAPDIEELAEPPDWANRAAALAFAAHSDLRDSMAHEALIEIAAKLPPSPAFVQRTPKIGTLDADASQEPPSRLLEPRPHQRALRQLLRDLPADGEPLSALDWKRARSDYSDLHDRIWLHCVIHEATLARHRNAHIRFERVEWTPSHPLSGNIGVRDLLVRRV